MSDGKSTEYYRHRERQERLLASACTDPAVAAIHVEMATRYAALAGRVAHVSLLRPSLRGAT